MMKCVLAGVFSVFLAGNAAAMHTFSALEDGIAALVSGDYETALKVLLPLAEHGIAEAQYNLGVMHDLGRGVPINDAEAVKWFRMAAEQRFIKAQFSLGFMHQLGEGVPQNSVRAHMWFNLAARQGDTNAIQFSYGLASRMTPDQIAEAQWMARSWLAAH